MIIVTGSSKGIGNAIANNLLKNGHEVVGISRTYPKDNNNFKTYIADVKNKKSLLEIANILKENKIDGLINCAGIGDSFTKDFLETTDEDIKGIFETNVLGTIYSCQSFIPLMDQKKHTPIINIASLSAHINTELAIYGSSKAAIYSFTRALAKRLSKTMIRPNCISPGLIDTDMISGINPIIKAHGVKMQIIDKMFTVDDICNIVEFLLDKKSESLTGQTFHIGGM
jgi:3-oxoacyl-[acyl-carrier protein] reductase